MRVFPPATPAAAGLLLLSVLCNAATIGASVHEHQPLKLASVGTDKVIVHLFEWSWNDIAKECEDLGRWGYWGVQVSPPQEDVLGNNWWTRYQPMSYKLQSRSGNAAEFGNMVKTCREHGVKIIVDVVINHMAALVGNKGRAGTEVPSKCTYPGLYSCDDFHHFCGDESIDKCGTCCNCQMRGCNDGGVDNIWHCDLGGLPDLDTSRVQVRSTLAAYLNQLVKLGVAGFRVDAAKHIDSAHLRDIISRVTSKTPDVYVNQEIHLDSDDCNCLDYARDYRTTGKIWEFKSHSVFYDALMHKNLTLLSQLANGTRWGPCTFASSKDAISFVVNHDFLVHPEDRMHTITMFNEGLYSVALVTLLAHPYGQPTLLSSINFDPSTNDVLAPVRTDQGNNGTLKPVWNLETGDRIGCGYWKEANPDKPYLCEHTWPEIRNMVRFRQIAQQGTHVPVVDYITDRLMSLSYVGVTQRSRAFLVVNVDDNSWSGMLNTSGMPAGEYCNVAGQGNADGCYPCTAACNSRVTVLPNGWVEISVGPMQTVAFHRDSRYIAQ